MPTSSSHPIEDRPMSIPFEAPLHRSLTDPILLAGAPRPAAILIGTLSAAIGIGLQLWLPGLLLWIAGHTLAVWAARSDPQFMDILPRHLKHKSFLDT
jgi:type IV secretory pathway TrbD component